MFDRLLPSRTSEEINFTRAAFLQPWNLAFLIALLAAIFLIGASSLTADIVLLFGLAAELLYLGIAPRTPRFQRLIRSHRLGDGNQFHSRNALIRGLSRANQKRYIGLERLKAATEARYGEEHYSAQGILNRILEKMDELLSSLLEMLHTREQYREITETANRDSIRATIAQLDEEIDEAPAEIRPIKKRRVEVLKKRLERYEQANKNIDILDAQIETIADAIRYIHEQALTLQDPDAVTVQLDMLLGEVEEMQHSVRELDDLFVHGTKPLSIFPSEKSDPVSSKESG